MAELVSIVVPIFNAEKYLTETIDSIVAQRYENWELVLVDDGSTDDSENIIKHFEEKDPRVRAIFQENLGVAAARNRGFQLTKGSLIAFLDSDDIWLPDNLEKKVWKFSQEEYGLVHSDAEIINSESLNTGEVLQGREGMILDDILLWNGSCIPGPSSILIRRQVLNDIGIFDERLSTSADQDLFIRIASKYLIGRVPEITWKYRIHEENMHKGISRMERDVLITFRKARDSGLIHKKHVRKVFGITYRILGASWIGDGKNPLRGLYYFLRSILIFPEGIFSLAGKGYKKLFR